MNDLLLDTCAAIWLSEDAEMSGEAVNAIDQAYDNGRPVHVCPFTAWEVGTLVARGRLPLAASPSTWFRQLIAVEGIKSTDLTPDILIASTILPDTPPRDPADRIIIATARELGLTILTRDRLILDYATAGNVRAIAC